LDFHIFLYRLKDNFSTDTVTVEIVEPETLKQIEYVSEAPKKQIGNQLAVTGISSEVVASAPPIPIFHKGAGRVSKVFLVADFDNSDLDQIIKILEVHKRPE